MPCLTEWLAASTFLPTGYVGKVTEELAERTEGESDDFRISVCLPMPNGMSGEIAPVLWAKGRWERRARLRQAYLNGWGSHLPDEVVQFIFKLP